MKKLLLLGIVAIISFAFASCTRSPSAANAKWETLEDVSYGDDSKQKLDMTIPQGNHLHALVYIHGGTYMEGTENFYGKFIDDYRSKAIVASIDYRLIPIPIPPVGMPIVTEETISFADMLADVDAAVNKVNSIAKTYKKDIKNFIIVGHSAGAHLTTFYSYSNPSKLPITTCVSLAGPADFTDDTGWSATYRGENFNQLIYLANALTGTPCNLMAVPAQSGLIWQEDWTNQPNYAVEIVPKSNAISSTYLATQGAGIPTLIIHDEDDEVVPVSNSIGLKNALVAAGTKVEFHQVNIPLAPGGNHHMLGGAVSKTKNEPILFDDTVADQVKEWLEAYLN